MTQVFRATMTLVTLVILLTWNFASISCQAPTASPEELRVLQLVNLERAAAGLLPLYWNDTLYSAAKTYSIVMASLERLSHTSLDGSLPWDRAAAAGYKNYITMGENIAFGQSTPEEVMNAWMHSPGHRGNILNPQFTEIGIALAPNNGGRLYWTQLFGARRAVCGNGLVDWNQGETCDDGNNQSGDGCSAECQVELGFTCRNDPKMIYAMSLCNNPLLLSKKRSNNKHRWPANPLIKKFLRQLLDEEEDGEEFDLFDGLSSAKSRIATPLAVRRSGPNGKLSEVVYDDDEYDGEEYDGEEYDGDEEEALMKQVLALGKRYIARDNQLNRRGRRPPHPSRIL